MKKKKYIIYEFEKLPVRAFGDMEIDDVAEFLCCSRDQAYPCKGYFHQGKYLVARAEDPMPKRNRFADAIGYACTELSHFTGENADDCIRRILARAMLSPEEYKQWVKMHA